MNVTTLSEGMSVGRYRLDGLVTRGGMGEVWRGHDVTLGRPVAVKLLHEGVSDDDDRERFIREARSAAQLNHPNIVAIFDVGEWNGRPFLVMELLEGRTLAEEVSARGPLPAAEVRDLGAQAAAGLAAAHAAGIVHRDIKPSNLVRTRDNTLKVVDFGIARVLDEASTRLTRTGTIVGTAAYLAPEQARGAPADARTDLYALGCVLYQLLIGRAPFVGGPTEVLYAHLSTPPEPPSRLRADVPPDLEAIVLALLAKDPRARPEDAATLRAALTGDPAAFQSVAAAEALTAAVPSLGAPGGVPGSFDADPIANQTRTYPVEDAPMPVRGPSPWRWLGLAAVVAAMVVVALVFWTLQNGQNSADRNAGAPPKTPTTTPSSSPSPTQTPTPEFGSSQWLHQLDVALAELAAAGEVDPGVAADLRNQIGDALNKLEEGDTDRARDKVDELMQDLAQARQDGDLSGIDQLNEKMGGTLPAFVLTGESGDNNNGDDNGKHGKGHRGRG